MPFVALTLAASLSLAAAALPKGQMDALALWAAAYRSCYTTPPFSLMIDREAATNCVEAQLRAARAGAPAALQGALDGLITETPGLVGALNAYPADAGTAPGAAAPGDPPLAGIGPGKPAAGAAGWRAAPGMTPPAAGSRLAAPAH